MNTIIVFGVSTVTNVAIFACPVLTCVRRPDIAQRRRQENRSVNSWVNLYVFGSESNREGLMKQKPKLDSTVTNFIDSDYDFLCTTFRLTRVDVTMLNLAT